MQTRRARGAFDRERGPVVSELPGDGPDEHAVDPAGPARRDGAYRNRGRDGDAALATTLGSLDVLEHGPGREGHHLDLDPGFAKEVELGSDARLAIGADDGADIQPEPRERERAIRHRTADPPAPWIAVREVARRRAHDEDDGAGWRGSLLRVHPQARFACPSRPCGGRSARGCAGSTRGPAPPRRRRTRS